MSATIECTAAVAVLGQILGRMLDPVPFFDYVGVKEVEYIKERIKTTKLDPDGDPWIPWTRYTSELREHKGNASQGIMWDTGALLDSIHFEVDGAFGVDIGTDLWYAKNQQEGIGKLPVRAIIGWEELSITYEQVFIRFLETGAP